MCSEVVKQSLCVVRQISGTSETGWTWKNNTIMFKLVSE